MFVMVKQAKPLVRLSRGLCFVGLFVAGSLLGWNSLAAVTTNATKATKAQTDPLFPNSASSPKRCCAGAPCSTR